MIFRKSQKMGHKDSLLCLVIAEDFPLHLQLNIRMITLWGEDFIYQCPEETLVDFICTSYVSENSSALSLLWSMPEDTLYFH